MGVTGLGIMPTSTVAVDSMGCRGQPAPRVTTTNLCAGMNPVQDGSLDVDAMDQAAQHLLGEHDFRNFCKADVVQVCGFVCVVLEGHQPFRCAGTRGACVLALASLTALIQSLHTTGAKLCAARAVCHAGARVHLLPRHECACAAHPRHCLPVAPGVCLCVCGEAVRRALQKGRDRQALVEDCRGRRAARRCICLGTEERARPHTPRHAHVCRAKHTLPLQIRCIAAVLLMVGRGLEPPSVVARLLDTASTPAKPQYNLAAEDPLLLYR